MTQTPPKSKDYTLAAKALLRRARHGVLSTFSKQVPGYPFGSVLPCALTANCEPILCISTLAAHTQNILQDPHVSFTVIEPGEAAETQAHARFVYMGIAERVADEQLTTVRDRFLQLVPSAQMYVGFGDFSFYTLKFTKGRYVGGFGAIGWIHPGSFAMEDAISMWAAGELANLNQTCQEHLQAFGAREGVDEVAIANIDTQGIDVRTSVGVQRREFPDALTLDSSQLALGNETECDLLISEVLTLLK